MTTTRLNNQHDYLTVIVTFDDGERVNLTWNRRGAKVSLTDGVAMKLHGQCLLKAVHAPRGETIGAWAERVCARARFATDVEDLVQCVKALKRDVHAVEAVM